MAGDAETGVAIMHVTAGWDSGAVYALGREPIHADDDYGTLAPRLETLGARLLVEVLDERPTPRRAGRVQGHLREQDRPARARPGPDADAGAGRAHDPRAAPAHRLPAPAARRHVPRRDRRARRRPHARPRRRPGAHGRAAAAAGLPRRRARAHAGQAARRQGHVRRGLAARPARREARPTSASTPRCPTARWRRSSSRPARVARPQTTSGSRTCARSPRAGTRRRCDHDRARRTSEDPELRELAAYVLGQLGTTTAALPGRAGGRAAGDGRA